MLSTKLKEAAGNSADATLYVDDVFSTYLYNGLNATQTITTGIDLATKGGLLWLKGRNVGSAYGYGDHELFDSANVGSTSKYLRSDGTDSISAGGSIAATPFTTTGFNLKAGPQVNNRAGDTTVAWTFRKAAKFFDVVTYTGTGSARTIAHNLGSAPGMVIVKRTDTTGNWQVYSNGLTSAAYSIQLNLTAAQASAPTVWNSTAPTSSVFSVGTDATVNASGGTYVAYLFAHDTTSTGVIQCGSYTTNGSGTATVTLGWEPQWLLYKDTGASGEDWAILDNMRGWTVGGTDALLRPNLSAAEVNANRGNPTATGFEISGMSASSTYIYMAIRRPNKPPTSGTQVYNAIARTGTGAAATVTGVGFPLDLFISQMRGTAGYDNFLIDRLRGVTKYLVPQQTYIEDTSTNSVTSLTMDGSTLGIDSYPGSVNESGKTYIEWNFKRAPGFFDEVCYTGTGANVTQAHNLTIVPEIIIIKRRSSGGTDWNVGLNFQLSSYDYLSLNQNYPSTNNPYSSHYSAKPTSSSFFLATNVTVNGSGDTYVAYLFATLAGISKVGSYTGNGSSQNIECGFAAGARFFLVKATSTTGSWWVWDSARGITAGNDPALQLNSTAAEITTADAVDPYSPGITVNQEATCSINASGVSYIFLAVA